MRFSLANNTSILTLESPNKKAVHLFVSKEISPEDMIYASLNQISSWTPSNRELVKISRLDGGWKVSTNGTKTWRKWWIRFQAKSLIFPTREGEYISNLDKIGNYSIYSLSYPGTASTKCVVIFTDVETGFAICGEPNLSWAKISLTRIDKDLILQILQFDQNLYVFPFEHGWQEGIKKFKKLFFSKNTTQAKQSYLSSPHFLLQMGVRDFFGNAHITKFTDLLPLIDTYRQTLGPNNVVHLFGTNPYGFDNFFPDFTIDPELGGIKNFKKLIDEIHKSDLLVSHHFNPRIADARWLLKNPEYERAIVAGPSGNPWIEFYKNNIYYVMDPSNENWLKLCLATIYNFKKMGIDYMELDQIAYQRNLFTPQGGFGKGYQKLIDLTHELGVKFWIEGVSDIFKLPEDCYSQVLPRDRMQLWETGENRRGYEPVSKLQYLTSTK